MFSRVWLFAAGLLAAPVAGEFPAQVVYPPNGLNVYASSQPFVCTSAYVNGVITPSTSFCAWLQNDGNFVVYYIGSDGSQYSVFSSQTEGYYCPDGNNVCNLVYQGDSNLVLYIGGVGVWSSDTVSSYGYNLVFSGGARPLDITGSWPAYPHAVGKKNLHSYFSAKPPGPIISHPGCREKRGVKGQRICP
ncbi:hypothetical protein F5Y14DRAFT_431243 [Nemania sp. NC0429]|nr:hypothetical protein F5Y14DRAFT_431243 [Nemania sp. NC0429]